MNRWFRFRTAILVVLLVIIMGWLSWKLPIVRQAFIRVFFPPVSISPPTLSSPNAILPDNLQNVQLLNHRGNGEFRSMAWSQDERYFGIGTTLGVNLYEGNSFRLLRYLELQVSEIDSLAFSPDNSLLAAASDGQGIFVYDLRANRVVNKLEIQGAVFALSFLRDGALVAVSYTFRDYHVWVMKEVNGEWENAAVMNVPTNSLRAVTFDQDSQLFVMELSDSIELIDPLTGMRRPVPDTDSSGAYLPSSALWIKPDEDYHSLVVHSRGKLLDTISFDDYFDQVLISPDGKFFAVLDRFTDNMMGGSIALWRFPELRQIRNIRVPDLTQYVQDFSPDGKTHLMFSPSGERLALWTSPSTVKVFLVAENSFADVVISDPYAGIADIGITPAGEIRGISCTGNSVDFVELPAAISIDQWYFDVPTCGQILKDGLMVGINEADIHTLLYEVGENNSPIATINLPCCDVFSFDGSVGAGSGGAYSGDPVTVGIWQKGIGFHEWRFYNSGLGGFAMAVSPSGQYVASVGGERTRLWVHGIESGRYYPALSRWPKIAFSPDEQYLASADAIMNLESGSQIVFEGMDDVFERMGDKCYPSILTTPAFSPDGQLIVAEVCGVLKFWSLGSGKLLAEIPDPQFSAKLIFSSDGTSLIGFAPGSIVIWGLPEQSR